MCVGSHGSQLQWWWKLTGADIWSPSLHQLGHNLSSLGDSLAIKRAVPMLCCVSLRFFCPFVILASISMRKVMVELRYMF